MGPRTMKMQQGRVIIPPGHQSCHERSALLELLPADLALLGWDFESLSRSLLCRCPHSSSGILPLLQAQELRGIPWQTLPTELGYRAVLGLTILT